MDRCTNNSSTLAIALLTVVVVVSMHQVFAEWERLSREEHRGALVPPSDWRAPPPAGYVDAQGMRRVEDKPWRPVS